MTGSGPDTETLAVYDGKADAYADMVEALKIDPLLDAFLLLLPAGGRILDLGAGPGHAAAAMRARGFEAEAWDPSPAMVSLARARFGLAAQLSHFDDLKARDQYDGIWANFSLLHARRADLPRHLAAIQTALRPGGAFHIAVKSGSGEGRDSLGRYYTYYTEAELTSFLEAAGFSVLNQQFGEGPGLSGDIAPWVAITARA